MAESQGPCSQVQGRLKMTNVKNGANNIMMCIRKKQNAKYYFAMHGIIREYWAIKPPILLVNTNCEHF